MENIKLENNELNAVEPANTDVDFELAPNASGADLEFDTTPSGNVTVVNNPVVPEKTGLSTGAKIGIGITITLLVGAAIGIGIWGYNHYQKNKAEENEETEE